MNSEVPANQEALDIDRLLRAVAQSSPDNVALTDGQRSVTWGELDRRINRIARSLIARGVGPGDNVATLGSNSVAYVEVMLATIRAGGCAVPLSSYVTARTRAAMVKDSGSRLLFVSALYETEMRALADEMGLPDSHVLPLDDVFLAEFIREMPDTPPPTELSPERGFNLIYSSGTTGIPKGIMQSRRYRACESDLVRSRYGLSQQTRTIVATPLCSNTTLFLLTAVLSAGGSTLLMEKFDARAWLEIAERWRPTDVVLVPVQYRRLLDHPEFDRFDLSSFRNKFCTSAPMPASTKAEILKRWPAGGFTELYGMTEGGVGCTLRAHEHPDKLDTVGVPNPGVEMFVIDEAGEIQPPGKVGELVGRSPSMMSGYHGREKETAEASWFDAKGRRFQRSGDNGWFDADGFLHLLDRKKDVIISGGFNVYAIDLENVLMQHPAVAEAAVIAASSLEWGETPVAYAVLRVPTSPESIRLWANERLGKAQRISQVIATLELPRSPIGKVLKRELRERFVNSSSPLGLHDESDTSRYIAQAEVTARRISDIGPNVPTRDILKVGIIGAGTMGGGIAMNFLNARIPVTLLEVRQDALDRGLATIRRNYEASASKGKLTAEQVEQRMALIAPTLEYEGLEDANLIIEAVFEEYAAKEMVFRKIGTIAKTGAILASNTSTLDINRIASYSGRPQDVLGLHFFSPANVMRLLEVVRGERTANDVLATCMALAERIGKVAVISGVCDGFIGNRMIIQYLNQAYFLLDEGALPEQIDRAMEKFGFAMGPFRMSDLAGNDITWAIRKRSYIERPERVAEFSRAPDLVCELGRFGQKTGKGWYDYKPGDRTPHPSAEVEALLAKHSAHLNVRRAVAEEEIVQRLIYALVNEGAKILDEGIAARASDIDVVYITGYGFPRERGGPMRYADSVGLANVCATIRLFSRGYMGTAWKLSPLLARLAGEGKSFTH